MDKDFETEVLTRLARIEEKLNDYDRIKTKADDAYAKSQTNEMRIEELEDKSKWLTRTITGAIITGVVTIALIFLKLGLGIN